MLFPGELVPDLAEQAHHFLGCIRRFRFFCFGERADKLGNKLLSVCFGYFFCLHASGQQFRVFLLQFAKARRQFAFYLLAESDLLADPIRERDSLIEFV
jgi:hypothetical protein